MDIEKRIQHIRGQSCNARYRYEIMFENTASVEMSNFTHKTINHHTKFKIMKLEISLKGLKNIIKQIASGEASSVALRRELLKLNYGDSEKLMAFLQMVAQRRQRHDTACDIGCACAPVLGTDARWS